MHPELTAYQVAQDPMRYAVASPCPAGPDPGQEVATRYLVTSDFTDPRGRRFLCVPLSEAFQTAAEAEAELEALRDRFPDAQVQRFVTEIFPANVAA